MYHIAERKLAVYKYSIRYNYYNIIKYITITYNSNTGTTWYIEITGICYKSAAVSWITKQQQQ